MGGYPSAVRMDFVFGRQPGHVLSSLHRLSEKDFQEFSFPSLPSDDSSPSGCVVRWMPKNRKGRRL